jgi:hypothetical protein
LSDELYSPHSRPGGSCFGNSHKGYVSVGIPVKVRF